MNRDKGSKKRIPKDPEDEGEEGSEMVLQTIDKVSPTY